MYEALVARVRYHIQKANFMGLKEAESTLLLGEAADAIEELNKLPAEQNKLIDAQLGIIKQYQVYLNKSRWIPVTKRLPKKECKTYWICTDSGYQCECRWTNNMYGLGESDNWGWHIMDKPQYQKVIAWRELPEPYEPPKEEI